MQNTVSLKSINQEELRGDGDANPEMILNQVDGAIDTDVTANLVASMFAASLGMALTTVNRDFGLSITTASLTIGLQGVITSLAENLSEGQASAITQAGSTLMTPLVPHQANAVRTGVSVGDTMKKVIDSM